METLRICDLSKEDTETGDPKVLNDLINAYAERHAKGKDEPEEQKKKVKLVLRKFLAFCSVLPQAPDLRPNTLKPSQPTDGADDEEE